MSFTWSAFLAVITAFHHLFNINPASSLPKPVEQPVINQTGLFVFSIMFCNINSFDVLILTTTATTPDHPWCFLMLLLSPQNRYALPEFTRADS